MHERKGGKKKDLVMKMRNSPIKQKEEETVNI